MFIWRSKGIWISDWDRSIKWTWNLRFKGVRVWKLEDWMLYYGCKDSGLLCWKFNAMVVAVLIFLKHNGLCGQAISSSQLCYQSISFTDFCACVLSLVCTLHARNLWRPDGKNIRAFPHVLDRTVRTIKHHQIKSKKELGFFISLNIM